MTLQIKAGRYYRTRDGRKVGPIERSQWSENDPWPWYCAGMYYKDDGRSCPGAVTKANSNDDLIAEWKEGQTLAELDVKQGDVIEWVGFEDVGHHKLDFIKGGFYVFDTPNGVYSHYKHCDDKFRLISRASDLSETAVQPVRDPELTSPYGDNNHPLPEDVCGNCGLPHPSTNPYCFCKQQGDKPRTWGEMTDGEKGQHLLTKVNGGQEQFIDAGMLGEEWWKDKNNNYYDDDSYYRIKPKKEGKVMMVQPVELKHINGKQRNWCQLGVECTWLDGELVKLHWEKIDD